MHSVLQFVSDNFETILTIFGSIIVGASAVCAFIPGAGTVKKILSILALNVKNATPEQIAKAKAIVDAAAKATEEKKEIESK